MPLATSNSAAYLKTRYYEKKIKRTETLVQGTFEL